MASGVIRIDELAIDDVELKIPSSSRRSSSNDRSSSGVSSECNSPSSIQIPANPDSPKRNNNNNNNYSNPEKNAYSNPGLQEDTDDKFSAPSSRQAKQQICTGVLSVHDELCIDFSHHLPSDLRPPTTTTVPHRAATATTKKATPLREGPLSRISHYLQCKCRSLPVSMLPLKKDTDQKPLSPVASSDENGNNRAAVAPASSSASAGAAPENPAAIARQQSTARPPFSCIPVYAFIIASLFAILLVSSINTVINMRPEFLYGPRSNHTTSQDQTTNSNSTFLT